MLGEKPQDNKELTAAFPAALHSDALTALSALPENPYAWTSFAVSLDNEPVLIPYRLQHNTALIKRGHLREIQNQLLNCILTRHGDGFLRQEYLGRIIGLNRIWVPPFVIQLLGEYVVEILRVIDANLGNLDKPLYAQFLRANPDFFALTEQRVVSYWDCYYRFSCRKEDYPGFRVIHFFKQLVNDEDRKTG
jgi:hypothetical protein